MISLGQTIYLAVFPQNLFTKVLCDPVYLLYFSGAGHHVGDDGGARQAPAGLFHVPLRGNDEDHHVGHLPSANRSLLPHQRTGKKEKDNHDSHSTLIAINYWYYGRSLEHQSIHAGVTLFGFTHQTGLFFLNSSCRDLFTSAKFEWTILYLMRQGTHRQNISSSNEVTGWLFAVLRSLRWRTYRWWRGSWGCTS